MPDNDGWIHRSQSYLSGAGPPLAIWILLAIWLMARKRFGVSAAYFLVSVPIGGYMVLLSVGLFFGGPPSGPKAEPWLRAASVVSTGWVTVFGWSVFGAIGYAIAATVQYGRNRKERRAVRDGNL